MPNDGATRDPIQEIRSVLETAHAPAALEDRVIGAARRDGLLAPATPEPRTVTPWGRLAAAAILALLAFGLGYWVAWGTVLAPDTEKSPVEGDVYALLLRETDSSAPTDPEENRRLVSEYGAWAREMARAGILVDGEKLDVGGVVLDASGEDFERRPWSREPKFLGGFFLIRAGSYDEAAEISRSCPHLKYGGEIEIRRIEGT